MIFLLGTSHSLQTESADAGPFLKAKRGRFRAHVEETVRSNNVAGIAEETNSELEARDGKSIARLVAEEMRPPLDYIACEPSSEERRALGIPTSDEINMNALRATGRDAELQKYFPVREKFWIDRLREQPLDSILFVCGANHVRTFCGRLTEQGFPCRILCFDWEAADDQEHGAIPLEERLI